MKKIRRVKGDIKLKTLTLGKAYCAVEIKDLDTLEQQFNEAVNVLIEVAIPLEDSSGGWGYYNELLQGIIEKLTGKTLEILKEERE